MVPYLLPPLLKVVLRAESSSTIRFLKEIDDFIDVMAPKKSKQKLTNQQSISTVLSAPLLTQQSQSVETRSTTTTIDIDEIIRKSNLKFKIEKESFKNQKLQKQQQSQQLNDKQKKQEEEIMKKNQQKTQMFKNKKKKESAEMPATQLKREEVRKATAIGICFKIPSRTQNASIQQQQSYNEQDQSFPNDMHHGTESVERIKRNKFTKN